MTTTLVRRHPLAADMPDDLYYLTPGGAEAVRHGCICSWLTRQPSIGCILHRERALRERAGRDWRRVFGGRGRGGALSAHAGTKAHRMAVYIADCAGVSAGVAEEILADAETLTYYYRIAAKICHPDRAEDKEAANEAFVTLKDAYDLLRTIIR